MTRTSRPSGRRSINRSSDPEDVFQRRVTLGFVGLIAAVTVTVVVALGYGFWDANLRPIANVGGTGISRDEWAARYRLEAFRLSREEARVRQALSAGEIDENEASGRLQSIAAARQSLEPGSLERLIDLTYQSQLAAEEGISVSEAEVDAAVAEAGTSPERRRIAALIVEPDAERPGWEPTPDERQEALRNAREALAALESGTPFADVVERYSTHDNREQGGDLGLLAAGDQADPVWTAALFALPLDGMTPLLELEDGSYRIGKVTEILPGVADPAYQADLRRTVSPEAERHNVRLETIARKLRQKIVSDATSGPVPQVHLAEIVVAGDTFIDPAEDEGRVRASHILYSPKDDPRGAASLEPADPAWDEAAALAEQAAAELRAVEDGTARAEAFVSRAAADSDDTAGRATGGDLGYFSRGAMVPEFADPLFDDPGLVSGDIVGPVRSAFGWHVILFADREAPLAERLEAVTTRLGEPDADFGAIAQDLSDGAEALVGGDLGWRILEDLDDVVSVTVAVLEPGETTDPLALDDGYHIYRLVERADRPLDAAQRAAREATAFEDWYQERRWNAEDEGIITQDDVTLDIGA